MPIQTGDVKLVKSANMADVAEGGGGPTGQAIPDGVSNAIFPDISELDRAGGRVNVRKVFVSVQSDDTETYLGANVIVADPPKDPRVSVTLFSTKQTFDTRSQAVARMEAYKIAGPEFDGYLFENHVQGQRVVQLLQRPNAQTPVVGQALVLIESEGLAWEKRQPILVMDVSVVQRTFTTVASGSFVDYPAQVVTLGLSDRLRYDFTGSPASRAFVRNAIATKVRESVVADAGSYAGVVPLTQAANIGDFSVQAASIYTQLVPSAQTETPLSDIRTNGVSAVLVATGGAITRTLSLAFSMTQALHVGAPIYPGSLSITRSGATVTDTGNLLMLGSEQVGTVDHANGIATLLRDVFGAGGGSHIVQFMPAAVPDLISEQSVLPVTAEGRSQSYAFTLGNPPLPGSVVISYLAQGRWYVLRDGADGKIKGSDASYGAGTVNYQSGSIVVTLGALPDVGSALLAQSYSDAVQQRSSNTTLLNAGRVYIPINSDGIVSEENGSKAIAPGSVSLGWSVGGATKLAQDDGLGNLTGDATGTVDYSAGIVRVSPNTLPAPGTALLLDLTSNSKMTTPGVSPTHGNLGTTHIKPGSVSFVLPLRATFAWDSNYVVTGAAQTISTSRRAYDRTGMLYFRDSDASQTEIACGTIDYAAGDINISIPTSVPQTDVLGPLVYSYNSSGAITGIYVWDLLATSGKVRTLALLGDTVLNVSFATEVPNADSLGVVINDLRTNTLIVPGRVLRGVSFSLGGKHYVQQPDDTLVSDPSPTTGSGTPSGAVASALGRVRIQSWATGASSALTDWRALLVPPSEGVQAPFCAFQTAFRTATAPLRSGSLSVLGTMQDGTTFNVAVGADGKINGARVKGLVDYEHGLVQLYFVNPDAQSGPTGDLSFLGIAGVGTVHLDLALLPSLRYNAVAYAYLPIDAELLGLDPVMLPTDGRVPIFQKGGYGVVGHTGVLETTVANGQTLNCGRVRLSRVRVVGQDGAVIHSGYQADLEAGTVTFSDVVGYKQPVRIEHRIEDMGVVQQVDISGLVTFTRQLSHNYPAGSYLSSALAAGDLFARVSKVLDQKTWSAVWSDALQGDASTAKFNHAQFPIAVTNRGAVTERWMLRFASATTYDVIGEHVGVIAVGDTSSDCAPINPATGVPYFMVPWKGWGNGWAAGNVLRVNTIGAELPVWVVRTVQQGPETVTNDDFTLLVRGDVDNPK